VLRSVGIASARGLAALLCCAWLVQAAVAAMQSDACHSRIVVSFSRAESARPDPGFVTQLARTARVHLTFLRALGPGLYSFLLTSTDHDPSCRRALERLKRDARVRSAEIDMRRRAQN